MKIIYLVLLVLVTILNGVTTATVDSDEYSYPSAAAFSFCPNRDPLDKLDEQFWKEQKKYQEIISDGRLNETRFSNLVVKMGNIDYLEAINRDCMSRQSIRQHDILCPYTLVYANRTDRYPFNVKNAVCNSNCGNVSHCKHECLPVLILKPVLIRTDKCDKGGYHIWEFRLEERAFQCYCANIKIYSNPIVFDSHLKRHFQLNRLERVFSNI